MSTTALKNSLELKKEAYTSFWEKGTPLIVNGTQTGTGFEDGYIPPPGMLYYETETYLKQLEKNRDRLHLRGDSLPMVDTDLGPGSLAVYLGSKPKREENTIWFQEVDENIRNLDISRVFKSEWWDRTLSVLQRAVNEFQGDYIVGMPDLVENWDVLASLSGASNLLILMLEQPELVAVKIEEINQAYFSVYEAIYKITAPGNGGGAFHAFQLWAPGKVAKLQCDGSAMFSKLMFDDLVLPALIRQASWLDRSIYHLDGTQAIHHLDSLLSISTLDAIEWTPQAGIETGIDPRWYAMFHKILKSGKKLQVLVTEPDHIKRFCTEIGTENVFFLCFLPDRQFQYVLEVVNRYR